METIGNFLTQPNKDFPLDCDTLDMLQAGTALVAALGNIAGDKLILTGCELTNNDTQRATGYVCSSRRVTIRTARFCAGRAATFQGACT